MNPRRLLESEMYYLTQEKFTNRREKSTQIYQIKKISDEKGLVDMGYIVLPYTWFNNQTHIAAASKNWVE